MPNHISICTVAMASGVGKAGVMWESNDVTWVMDNCVNFA